MSEPIPAKAHESRPVQVRYLHTSVLVEYVPAYQRKPRVKKAEERGIKAAARRDSKQAHLATIDWLAEMLTEWSHLDSDGNPTKPTRAALSRQPVGWLQAAVKAVTDDRSMAVREFSW